MSARERTVSADNARSQPITPVRRRNSKWSVFLQLPDEEIRKFVEKAVPESIKKSTCFASCFVLSCFRAAAFAVRGNIWRIIKTINYFWLLKYARIVVLGHYLFLEAHNCSLLGTDNIVGQLSVHILAYTPATSSVTSYIQRRVYAQCVVDPGFRGRIILALHLNFAFLYFSDWLFSSFATGVAGIPVNSAAILCKILNNWMQWRSKTKPHFDSPSSSFRASTTSFSCSLTSSRGWLLE